MRSSSTSSSDRTALQAFALAAALVLAGDATIAASLPVNRGRHDVDALLADLEDPRHDAPLLLLGDSVTLDALAHVRDTGPVEDRCTNLALGFPGNAFVAARALSRPHPPRVIVLAAIPETFAYELESARALTYFETVFLRTEELRRVHAAEGTSRRFLRMVRNRLAYPPSYHRRGSLLAEVPLIARWAHRDVDRERWFPPWDAARFEEAIRTRSARTFRVAPLARRYLEWLLEDAEDAGARVVLVTPPIPTEVLASWRTSGYLGAYIAELHALRERYPLFSYTPADAFADFPAEDYYDPVHLWPRHRARYGERLLGLLRKVADDGR